MSKAKDCLQKLFCHHATVEDKDSGRAWLVLFWCIISLLLSTGFFIGIYGSITLEQQNEFGLSLQESSLISSINNCMIFCFGPLASFLMVRISYRFVEIVGGALMIVGIGGSMFSTEVWHAYLLFGIIGGVGGSCCYMASTSVPIHHFDKYKYVAFSFLTLGFYSGLTIFPTVSERLFAHYGYSTSMGIFGLIMALHIVGGLFFTEKYSFKQSNCSCCPKFISDRVIVEPQDVEEQSLILGSEAVVTDSPQTSSNTLDVHNDNGSLKYKSNAKRADGGRSKTISAQLAFKMLLSDWKVWCLMVNMGLWNLNRTALFIFINNYMVKQVGLSPTEAALGVTINGASSWFGVFFIMAMGRLDFNRIACHCFFSVIMGADTVVIAFSNGQIMYYGLSAVFGLASGAFNANFVAAYYDFCGGELFPFLLSIDAVGAGLAGLAASPVCGYLEMVVHPIAGLCTCGAAGIVGGLIIIPVLMSKILVKQKSDEGDLISDSGATQNFE